MCKIDIELKPGYFFEGMIGYRIDSDIQFVEKIGVIKYKIGNEDFKTKRNFMTWKHKTKDIRAIIFISHGLFEHALCYNELAIQLAHQGYLVHAMDHYGHGLSEGDRANPPDYKTMPNDFIRFMKFRQMENPSLPCFLLSHCLGSLIGVIAAEKVDFLSGIIISGIPTVLGQSSGSPLGIKAFFPISQSKIMKVLNRSVSHILPGAPCAPINLKSFSPNKEVLDRNTSDKRRCKPIILSRMADVLMESIEIAKNSIANLEIPILILHGESDMISLPEGSQQIFEITKSKTQSELHIFQGYKHELLNEMAPYDMKPREIAINFIENLL